MMPSLRMEDMSGPLWGRVQTILDEALDLPASQVASFLDSACGDDAELRAIVETLLRADESAGPFLESSAVEYAPGLLADACGPITEPSAAGRRIGPWRVVREIARGGMGTVYLAERADGGFGQKVALKLIRRGLDSDEILQRFLRERRILAGLEHKHIARLVDGGITDDGLPWFAMEYVEGEAITGWCDERRVDVMGRLQLFRAVCGAVQYAHRMRVVHRDLKPSNIFVTADGDVKLLDFGIARLLGDEESEGGATLTQDGRQLLTPRYAAPEQIRGEAATTATDVYGLGVMLYELLAGAPPHGGGKASLEDLRRAVLNEQPAPPSERRRGWRHILRGDLDNIVLMALRKEPDRRYPSVEALLGDLERHRVGLPVRATPPSLRYRFTKFVGRHQVAAAALLAVTVMLLAGIIVAMWESVAILLAAAVMAGGLAVSIRQTRLAHREARKAEEIRGFLIRVFEVTDPSQSRGQSVTARELLDQGARRIETEFTRHPALRAELMGVLGDLYARLGQFEPGLPLVEREIDLLRTLPRIRPGRRADAMRRLGKLLLLKGDWTASEVAFREAADLRRASRGAPGSEYAEDLDQLAAALRPQAKLEEAEQRIRQSLEIRRRLHGDEHPEVADSLNNLALMMREAGRLDSAETFYRESLRIRRETLGHDHPDVGSTLNNLAVLLRQMGRYEEAVRAARDALAIQTKLYGEDHAITIATTATLGALSQNLGRYDDAEQMQRRVLAYWDAHGGRGHPNAVASLNNLAAVLREKGAYDEAEALQREAVDRWRSLVGDRHPYYASGIINLAAILREKGGFDEAAGLLDQALEIHRGMHGDDHPEVAAVLFNQALLADRRGRLPEAEGLYRRALEVREKHLGTANPTTAVSRALLASTMRREGATDGIEAALRDSLATLRRFLPARHPEIASTALELGRVIGRLGRNAEAQRLFEEAVEIRRACYASGSPQVVEAERALAESGS